MPHIFCSIYFIFILICPGPSSLTLHVLTAHLLQCHSHTLPSQFIGKVSETVPILQQLQKKSDVRLLAVAIKLQGNMQSNAKNGSFRKRANFKPLTKKL